MSGSPHSKIGDELWVTLVFDLGLVDDDQHAACAVLSQIDAVARWVPRLGIQ